MRYLFVSESIVNPYTLITDSTLLRTKGKVGHKYSMKKGKVPCSGIDTDAMWDIVIRRMVGYLDTNCIWYRAGSSSSSSTIVPLSADVTTANIHDNNVYPVLTSSCLHPETIKKIHYMTADPGYDNDQNIYDLSIVRGFQLVYPVVDTKQPHQKKDFD